MEIGHQLVSYIRYVKNEHPLAYPRIVIDSDFEITFRLRSDHMERDLDELKRFYDMITKSYLMKTRAQESGIHIHTNLMTVFNYRKLLNNSDIDEVVKLIASHFNYTGTFNQNKFSTHKGNSVIYRSCYNTLEYRCIPMTWQFSELIKYMTFCHALTNGFQMYSKGQCDLKRIKEIYEDWHTLCNMI
jgi:hypothetical protein